MAISSDRTPIGHSSRTMKSGTPRPSSRLDATHELLRPYPNQRQRVVYRRSEQPSAS
jgi:hypothetical protein